MIVFQKHACWGNRDTQERWGLSEPQEYTAAYLQEKGVCTLAYAQQEWKMHKHNAKLDVAIKAILDKDMRYVVMAKERLAGREVSAARNRIPVNLFSY